MASKWRYARLMRKSKSPLDRRAWDRLSPAQKERRKRSLMVLNIMRQGVSMAAAAKEVGIHRYTVLRHLGTALIKRGGKYYAKPKDRISRGMIINSRGRQIAITIIDSKAASIIGQYHNAIRQYLNTGDKSALREFQGIIVVDSAGVSHRLETDIRKIKAIESAKEEPEFFEIYRS